MDVADTKPLEKSCSKCGETKLESLFIPNRNICKKCRNKRSREKYTDNKIVEVIEQSCNFCNVLKTIDLFIKNRKICKDCNNNKRKEKYKTNEEFRVKTIKQVSIIKHNKVIERQKKKEEEIGIGNKKCSNCNNIKVINCFRYNRLKCKDCERDEPLEKLKRVIRSRILCALNNKQKHTVEYLGCSVNNYIQWLQYNDKNFTLENRGKEWHIDHVIPLSKFNLENKEEQLVAFNWRNTMALSPKENLSKNAKIIPEQIQEHFKNLQKYHEENNIELPQKFIDLFAKHPVAGSP